MTTPTQERIAQQIAEIEREMAGLRAEVGFMHSDLSELQAELRRRLRALAEAAERFDEPTTAGEP